MTTDLVFGNPWHGKLAAGTIELEAGTPVASVTVDGATFGVQSVPGNLGDTRYCCRPPYPPEDPYTPPAITALHGVFKQDMILYSDSMRWSPLSNKAILDTVYQWLLWDTTAGAWRKMRVYMDWKTLSTNPGLPSAEDSPCVDVFVQRGDIVGRLDHDIEDTPDGTPSWTNVGVAAIPYKYTVTDFTALYGGMPYGPLERSLSIDARRDGLRIMVSIFSDDSWNPYALAGTRLRDVWEIVISDGGASVTSFSQIVPPEEWPTAPSPDLWRHVSAGAPYSIDSEGWSNWGVPVVIQKRETVEYFRGERVLAAYDKDGAPRLMYYIKHGIKYSDYTFPGYALIGSVPLGDPCPAYSTGPTEWSTTWPPGAIFPEYANPDFTGASSYTDISVTSSAQIDAKHAGTVIATAATVWDDPGDHPPAVQRITNNVSSINVGTDSLMRVGPGAAHVSTLALPVYATFDHRADAVYSSAAAIGVV